jgi:hypothetical protein
MQDKSKKVHYTLMVISMRILERVQAFLPFLTIEIFLIFPPSSY